MKTIGILISAVAIAAGILVGHSQYERERAAVADKVALETPAPVATERHRESPRAEGQGVAADRGRKPRVEAPAPEDIVGAAGEKAADDPTQAPRRQEAEGAPGPAAFLAQLDEIESLIREQEFDKARQRAEELTEANRRGPTHLQAKALRLRAKASAFDALLASLPKPSAEEGAGDHMEEVLLANRNKVLASKVEKEHDRYVIHLANGIVYRPPLEEVLEVRPIPRSTFLQTKWQELEKKTAKLNNSIDLFILGVQECYKLGLKKEGLVLLERLLALPDSDQIPLLFIPEAGEGLIAEWRIASGRLTDEAVAARAAALGAEAQSEQAPGTATGPASEPRAASPDALVEVSRLLGEAQALYQGAATKEGREKDLLEARKRLERAFQLLEALPSDETVKSLRRRLSQLLSDVVRVSPF